MRWKFLHDTNRLLAVAALASAVVLAPSAHAQEDLTDRTISDKIEDEMFVDRGVLSHRIDVMTADGVVTLRGEVDNILAKERALRIAETVKGVRSVVNRIEVDPSDYRLDPDIQSDIEAALLSDPAAESTEVQASVTDGAVTLTGTVDSYRERELVNTVVKGVRGVTAVTDNIMIEYDSPRTDREIEHEVEQTLSWDVHVDDEQIETDVGDGVVTLTGTVGSAAEKRLARNDAWVRGVEDVDDSGLVVSRWARDAALRGDKYVVKPADELIAAVNDAMLYDPRVNSFEVDVEATGNAVTLRGKVDNLAAKRAAAEDARNTVGVAMVDNHIKVRLDTPPEDETLESNIDASLRRSTYVDRFDLQVNVIDGTAHLYGTVDSFFEKNRADELASRVRGVVEVENHLTVSMDDDPYIYNPYVDLGYVIDGGWIGAPVPSASLTDSQIENSIESELWWSPFVDADDVKVDVDDGIATLTGVVDSWSELAAATENAYEGGAMRVDNDLIVASD